MRKTKIEEAMLECYRRLYKAATPSADFDELLEKAQNGIPIPYLDYEIEVKKEDEIIKQIIKEYKMPKMIRERFFNTIKMGVSPKKKKND